MVVGVEEDELSGVLGVSGLEDDAARGRDADAAGEEDGGNGGIVVQHEFAPGRVEGEFGADGNDLQGTFEGSVAHTRGDDEVRFIGRTG